MRRLLLTMIMLLCVGSAMQARHTKMASIRHKQPWAMTPLHMQPKDSFPEGFRTPHELWQAVDSIPLDTVWLGYNPLLAPRIFAGYRHYVEPREPFVPRAVLQEPAEMPTFKGQDKTTWNIIAALGDAVHADMVRRPQTIDFAKWNLPVIPELPPDETTFTDYIKKLRLPWMPAPSEQLPATKIDRIHWLHVFNGDLQFSQAYLSKNWYQGGTNYLALLVNFYWNVSLNKVYHPNLLFESTVSYKLGLSSTQNNEYHKYTISEDLFQWNLKTGFRARQHWFYTLTAQFKTQFLNNYPADSYTRTAAFLSPGELNLGLGMTYSTQNRRKTCTFQASLSPASYNLKTCLDGKVDPMLFNIPAGKKTVSEIGSSAELTLNWNLTPDINLKSRLFAFTDYKYYMNDLETTLSFSINRFLSTQIYAHLRYDSSSDLTSGSKWKHWMLKEILSFGFSYHFQTTPK